MDPKTREQIKKEVAHVLLGRADVVEVCGVARWIVEETEHYIDLVAEEMERRRAEFRRLLETDAS